MDDARDYEISLRSMAEQEAEKSAPLDDESRVLTFAELQELIETGKVDQIPNNKIIPEALNVGTVFH